MAALTLASVALRPDYRGLPGTCASCGCGYGEDAHALHSLSRRHAPGTLRLIQFLALSGSASPSLCVFLLTCFSIRRNAPALWGVCIRIDAREHGIYWFGLPLRTLANKWTEICGSVSSPYQTLTP